MALYLIAAVDHGGSIGLTKDGVPGLPWPRLEYDMAWYHLITKARDPLKAAFGILSHSQTRRGGHNYKHPNTVVCGRVTSETLPLKAAYHYRIKRVVLQHDLETSTEQLRYFSSYREGVQRALDQSPHAFVIGGYGPYSQALVDERIQYAFITEVQGDHRSDVPFPIPISFKQGRFVDAAASEDFIRVGASAWVRGKRLGTPDYRFSVWIRIP